MERITVQKLFPHAANLDQLPGTRQWMEETAERHAYMCFPLTLTNRLGWGISFPEDISFIWDGVTDTTPDHIRVIKGEQYVSTTRGNATISFSTGLLFKTAPETTMMTMPVPNLFTRGAQCYTSLISTSFYFHSFPLAWRVTEPNLEITIPANTPVAALIPLSVNGLQDEYEMCVTDQPPTQEYWDEVRKYGDAAEIKNGVGDWSKMYRDAVNYKGDSVGSHETKSIKLKTVTCPFTGQTYEVEDGDQDGHAEG